MRPLWLPPLFQDSAEEGRLLLRDGSTATVRLSRTEDHDAILAFHRGLSPESRQSRFAGLVPDPKVMRELSDSTDPGARIALLVTRLSGAEERIVAVGSYAARPDGEAAELGIAVDDAFQGRGIGSLLLERLAILAARNGFVRLIAHTRHDNGRMLRVLKESGFDLWRSEQDDLVEVSLMVTPSGSSSATSETRDRVSTNASLRPFFAPGSVVVVTAPGPSGEIGLRILEELVTCGFGGAIHSVHPDGSPSGLRPLRSVQDLPGTAGLAVIAVPREEVFSVVEDCAAKGARALVVVTSGFAEAGPDGRNLQDRLLALVRGHGMRMLGPNSFGLINTDPSISLNASFSRGMPPPGRVALSSQSGAVALAVLSLAKKRGVGISTFASVGNKADVSGNDLLQYWEETATGVILLYLESFGNPRRFARIARRVTKKKPVVIVKSGRSSAGGRAAGSHTAALAGADVAVDALFRQTGIIRAQTLAEMFDFAALFGTQPLPRGRRVGIVTNAGGAAILCSDACEEGGLEVPELSLEMRAGLRGFLPPAASAGNPVDMTANATAAHYERTVAAMLASEEIDALVVMHVPVVPATHAGVRDAVVSGLAAGRAGAGAQKPVLLCLMAEEGEATALAAKGEQVPVYAMPEDAARALARAADHAEDRAEPPGTHPDLEGIDAARGRAVCRANVGSRGAGWLTAREARDLLAAFGLPLPPGGVAATPDEAAAIAERIGFPVAMKLASTKIVHKTEVKGVQLDLADAAAVREAFVRIEAGVREAGPADAMDGVIVQPMLSGTEVMVGVTSDPVFGPLIAFGLGGIHVEVLADVKFRVTPLTDRDAAELVREIRGRRLLEGYRGHPAADLPALEELLLRVSRMVEEVPEIGELDLNPVMAMPPGQGCRIADVRVHVDPPSPAGPKRSARRGVTGSGQQGPGS